MPQKKRKTSNGRKATVSAVITSSPYKNDLVVANKRKKENENKITKKLKKNKENSKMKVNNGKKKNQEDLEDSEDSNAIPIQMQFSLIRTVNQWRSRSNKS